MVGAILPVVYGDKRLKRPSRPAALIVHGVGCVGGAMVIGAFAGILGSMLPLGEPRGGLNSAAMLSTGALSLVFGLCDVGLVGLRVPTPKRQVPASWRLTLHPYASGLWYGVLLGVAVGSYIPVSSLYITLAWVLLVGEPVRGALTMAAFGIGRVVPLVILRMTQTDWLDCCDVVSRMWSYKSGVRQVNGWALIIVGATILMLWALLLRL